MLSGMQPKLSTGIARWAIVLAAVGLFILAAPVALADQPSPVDPNTCALCHQDEVRNWQNSPHASAMNAIKGHEGLTCQNASDPNCDCLTCHTTSFDVAMPLASASGVTCEACHGPLVAGHPESGEMPLDVDSSICSDCHVDTHAEWQTTPHGQAGVQCIGCHNSHTQNLRLDDQKLCESCHSERLQDSGHVAHAQATVACIDCHTSPADTALAVDGAMPSPSHEFSVNTAVCESCHSDTFQVNSTGTSANTDWNPTFASTSQASAETAAALMVAETGNRQWLQGATALSFGLGIGVGGMAGILFVLIAGFMLQRLGRSRS
ncbi:MAG: hypothetical protein KDH08_15165 [Anaerolineae bacterium]|nr:hypothetical protein [Anaerolineae bacterium]MCB0230376.1 hypothetical protein [Anaerolineae bacterium]MCB0233704.1 hypothetical protein [Anaerolineae bacterium]MCB0239945.1 hypothetical protein [Anaerolineae bacterium]MCB9131175.1 hypothetical protein [Anaerolineales bacterium]